MNITVNGKPYEVEEATTLEQVLQLANIKTNGIATALNNAVVPAVMRPKTVLVEGDSVTVITAFYGG